MAKGFVGSSFALVIALLLGGCETAGLPSIDFSSQEEKGTLVVGLVGNDDTKFTVIVAPLNEDGTVSSRGGDSIEHTGGKTKSFYTIALKPGSYLFRSVNWGNRLSKYVVCLNQETYAFSIEIGQVIYAGDIAFNRASFGYGAASFVGNTDRGRVAQSLSGDPLVTGTIADAQLRPMTFEMGRNLLNSDELCGTGSF